MNENLFVLLFTLVAGFVIFVFLRISMSVTEKRTNEYLRGRRMTLLNGCIPGCQYTPEGSVNGKAEMMRYAAGEKYCRNLGYLSFSGKYENVRIDDAITWHDSGDSDRPDTYYESLLFEYRIPADSPVYQLGYMNVSRIGKLGAVFDKAASFVKNNIWNKKGASDMDKAASFTIGNSDIKVNIPACPQRDRWIMLLNQGLSEKIEELFRKYRNASHIEMCYKNDVLFLGVSYMLGNNEKFGMENDVVIGDTGLICDTMELLRELC